MTKNDELHLIADYYGIAAQTDKSEEEVREMLTALEDYYYFAFGRSEQSDTYDEDVKECETALIEEMSDVQIMITQLVYLLHDEESFSKEIDYKLRRQIKRIEEERKNGDYTTGAESKGDC